MANIEKSGNKILERIGSNVNSFKWLVKVKISTILKCNFEISTIDKDMHYVYSSHFISRNFP